MSAQLSPSSSGQPLFSPEVAVPTTLEQPSSESLNPSSSSSVSSPLSSQPSWSASLEGVELNERGLVRHRSNCGHPTTQPDTAVEPSQMKSSSSSRSSVASRQPSES